MAVVGPLIGTGGQTPAGSDDIRTP